LEKGGAKMNIWFEDYEAEAIAEHKLALGIVKIK